MLTPTKPVKSCECSGSCGDCCSCTKESIGLGNVDNTSDLNKPLSTDMVNALSGKVDLDIFTQLKNRVVALESTITEIPDLKVRIGQCELDIMEHYEAIKRLQSTTKSMADTITELGNRVTGVNDDLVTVGTRIDALEAKDSNNVKLSGVNVQTIQGTLKANNPESGATDKTLVTANWVSQTGEGRPNNLIHDVGNENISGIKRHISGILGQSYQLNIPSNGNYYIEIAYKGVTTQFAKIEVFDYINQIDSVMWDIYLVWNGGANNSRAYGRSLGNTSAPVPKFTVDNGILKLILKAKSYHSYLINVTIARSWSYNQEVTVTTVNDPDYSELTLTDMVIQ